MKGFEVTMGRSSSWSWFGVGVLLLATSASAQGTAPPPKEEHVRGDVAAVAGDALTVNARGGGAVVLKLADGAHVYQVEKADLGSIARGTFVGTTALAQPDGTLRAVEVHVFPESMRGTGEGHRPWDLGGSNSSMTNATVSGVRKGEAPGGSMTNATVAGVRKGGTGETLSLEYKGGRQTVVVPPGTPIVALAPGDRSRLVPGAHVFAGASREADGTLVARFLVVGKGIVPPM